MVLNWREFPLIRGFVKKEENVIYLDPACGSGMMLYAERKYCTWDSKELSYINRGIRKAIRYGYNVNLSELKKLMPHRSISSIRCKVLWYLNRIGFHIGTYTEKD